MFLLQFGLLLCWCSSSSLTAPHPQTTNVTDYSANSTAVDNGQQQWQPVLDEQFPITTTTTMQQQQSVNEGGNAYQQQQNVTNADDGAIATTVTSITMQHQQQQPVSTTPPLPPVVERIEVRLIADENTTQETPLIIVDLVKKNGSSVAATIQQQPDGLVNTKPDQGFLLRVRQPNYHSVYYVPFVEQQQQTTAVTSVNGSSTEETSTPTTTSMQEDGRDRPNSSGETTSPEMRTEIPMEQQQQERVDMQMEGKAEDAEENGTTEIVGQMVQIVPKESIVEKTVKNHNQTREQQGREEPLNDNAMDNNGKIVENATEQEERREPMNGNVKKETSSLEESEDDADNTDAEDDDEEVDEGVSVVREPANIVFGSGINGSTENGAEMGEMGQEENATTTSVDDEFLDEGAGGTFDWENGTNMEMENGAKQHEECLANVANLPKEMVNRLVEERRRVVHSIKKINKHQMLLCRPNRAQQQVPYRKCSMWRREKFFLYYALMRVTYCSDHARWPGGKRFRAL